MGQKCPLRELPLEINRLRGSAGATVAAGRPLAKILAVRIRRDFNILDELQVPPSGINECFSFEHGGRFRVTPNIQMSHYAIPVGHLCLLAVAMRVRDCALVF
jgi:hypothetical protein